MMLKSTFRQPEFLTAADEPVHRIRCPIHGFIRFSENERKIIDHRLFRRLRWIRQLALTELVYPGATHTRFEHSLGVMEVATRIFDALARSRGDVMESTFATVEQLKDKPLAKARQLVRLAALLHDIGHCCFSHAAEEVIQKDSGHEGLTVLVLESVPKARFSGGRGSCRALIWRANGSAGASPSHFRNRLLTNSAFLEPELNRLFFPGCAVLIGRLIKVDGQLPPQLQVLRDIVSGQVDADRMDYLLRDSHHCGVDYGLFDYRRMIECLTLQEDPEGSGGLEIAMQRDGIHTFEALILARYQMNTQVYYHRLRRIYDLYLKEYFKAKGNAELDTPEKILGHNDMTMISEIIRDADRTGEPFQPWAQRIRDRRHHHVVYESDEDVGAAEIRKVKGVLGKIKDEYSGRDFQWDLADVSIHKLLLPEDKDDREHVPFSMVDTDRTADLLGKRSPILRKIPRWFQVARIFADMGRDEKPLQQEIAAKCKSYAKV